MSGRDVRRYVAALLRGRRPRSFRAEDGDVAELRAAIALRTARPGSGAPREEFVTGLHRRLAAELSTGFSADEPEHDASTLPSREPDLVGHATRRRVVQAASVAAAAATIGAGVDHLVTSGSGDAPNGGAGDSTLVPATGQWRTVAASTELAEGGVRGFDLGTVIGFVARSGGQVQAVSGVCTHLGCRLALDAAARQLNCPCHDTSFAVSGQLLHYQLAVAPRALPQLEVREVDGVVQVYVPPGPGV